MSSFVSSGYLHRDELDSLDWDGLMVDLEGVTAHDTDELSSNSQPQEIPQQLSSGTILDDLEDLEELDELDDMDVGPTSDGSGDRETTNVPDSDFDMDGLSTR